MTERWRKSSHSGGSTGNCLEARIDLRRASIRDTQNRDAATLAFPAREWVALLNDLDHMGGPGHHRQGPFLSEKR